MVTGDSAFLWETEVLRASRRPTAPEPGTVAVDDGDWVTLRAASEATGIPLSTIRKWARHDNIPSFLDRTPEGHFRLVSMNGIRRWAEAVGRELEESDQDPPESSKLEPVNEVDLTVEEATEDGAEVPEGSMLVPLDAWNRMLNQLGNLHEAGQQLAEARERAAKAETEAVFLKERLRELRAEIEEREKAVPPPDPEPVAQDEPATSASVLRSIYGSLRRRRRS